MTNRGAYGHTFCSALHISPLLANAGDYRIKESTWERKKGERNKDIQNDSVWNAVNPLLHTPASVQFQQLMQRKSLNDMSVENSRSDFVERCHGSQEGLKALGITHRVRWRRFIWCVNFCDSDKESTSTRWSKLIVRLRFWCDRRKKTSRKQKTFTRSLKRWVICTRMFFWDMFCSKPISDSSRI